GVVERVELRTADMQQLPFADSSFDLVVTSMAIHNIRDAEGRKQAINEAVRVLKPGGKLVIVDFRETQRYEERLRELEMTVLVHQTLGWRFWYGSPCLLPGWCKHRNWRKASLPSARGFSLRMEAGFVPETLPVQLYPELRKSRVNR